MKFYVPNNCIEFFINCDELLEKDVNFFQNTNFFYDFKREHGVQLVALSSISPPMRDGQKIWFRDNETVVGLLLKMKNKDPLPPVTVWSLGKKLSDFYSVRDGFHRFYLSIAMGYTHILIRINDWDFEV